MPSPEAEASPCQGVRPCLRARLCSSRLIQCQEEVPLSEGRKDLEELLLGGSGTH